LTSGADCRPTTREDTSGSPRGGQVGRLDLFGSAVGDKFDRQSSDLDFIVEFGGLREDEYADTYFGFCCER
jgi:predicted nucleotidyltransferase